MNVNKDSTPAATSSNYEDRSTGWFGVVFLVIVGLGLLFPIFSAGGRAVSGAAADSGSLSLARVTETAVRDAQRVNPGAVGFGIVDIDGTPVEAPAAVAGEAPVFVGAYYPDGSVKFDAFTELKTTKDAFVSVDIVDSAGNVVPHHNLANRDVIGVRVSAWNPAGSKYDSPEDAVMLNVRSTAISLD